MSEISSQIDLYDALLKSIDTIIPVRESIEKERALLLNWKDYLHQNEPEITKFGKSTIELQTWLDLYDFAKGYNFRVMQKKLEELHPLRLRLVKMGEEAKKLSVFPDRYNSKKSIEVCRKLAVVCMERMSLEETAKLSNLVEANTRKLIEIQKLFERDGTILTQINMLIDVDRTVLMKFKAYYAGLMQYVSEFPHETQDDLDIVKQRIAVAKQINLLFEKAEKAVQLVVQSVGNVSLFPEVVKYQEALTKVKTIMRTSDADVVLKKLDEMVKGCAILYKMYETVKANENVLGKFKAYHTELVQYVQSFPHDGQDNMAVVDNRIATVKKMDLLLSSVEKAVSGIRNYYDRYNKNTVVANCSREMQTTVASMKYNDIGHIENKLNDLINQVRSVSDAFEKEFWDLNALADNLRKRSPEVWKEDNESLLSIITRLLNKNPRQCDFCISDMKTSYSNAKLKHMTDVVNTKKQYPWLETKKRYKKEHDKLITRYITSDDYYLLVKKLKRDRIKRIILLCIPIIGWIILYKLEDVTV